MTDKNLIEISQIKDLSAIYFYYTNSSFENLSKYLGLRVVYGNHKFLKYDYRSEYFSDFVSKVFDVYKNEKNNNDIILLGDLSKEILQTDISNLYNNYDKTFSQNIGIPLLNNNTHQILLNQAYIKEILSQILRVITLYPLAQVDSIRGYNNNYVAAYSIEDIKGELPFICCFDNDIISITLNSINGKAREINVTMKYDKDKVLCAFKSKKEDLIGTTIYDYNDAAVTRKTVFDKEIIDYHSEKLSIEDDDLSTVKFYSDMFSLGCNEKVINTVPGSFIFFDTKKVEENKTDILIEEKSIHFFIKEDEVNIFNLNKAGLAKSSTDILFSLNESSEKITLKLIQIDNKSYVIVQKFNEECDKSDGFYKNNLEGKFSYIILEVDNTVRLDKPFEIKDSYKIEERVQNLENLKTLIKKKQVE